jgi:hypothetical protein
MNGTLVPVVIGGIRSLKDGSVAVTVETQELSPGKAGELFALRNKICYVYFSERQIELPERKMIDSLEPEMQGKSPSLRLRNVLFVAWQQNPEGYPDADSYYRAKMELIISTYKANLV